MLHCLRRVIPIFIALLATFVATTPAEAQHPTSVTSIVNSDADTTLEVNYNGSLLMQGTLITDGTENDSIPASGGGARMMWYPAKAAFRGGYVIGSTWDASNIGAYSVALGDDTEASAGHATAMGNNTTASDNAATALGFQTTASDGGTTAMGNQTTASGNAATAMNYGATASGEWATAMGNATTAATSRSLSIGECNSTNTSSDNSLFVVGNGQGGTGTSCRSQSDALVLDESGDLSIEGVVNADLGTYAGHFQETKSSITANRSDHITLVENTSTAGNSDALAIQTGPDTDPASGNNFVTFFDGNGDAVGAVEGNGSGGVDYSSGGADFAEELPVAVGAELPKPADLVGVYGGKASLQTEQADRVMIASTAPIMTGNTVPATAEDDARRVAVAFVGQVPAKVRGTAQVGDLIVASGKSDGTGLAVTPSEYRRAEHGPIAGQAWSAKTSEEVGKVTVTVGLGRSGAVAEQFKAQRKTNQRQEAQIEDLKNRLAALEEERSSSVVAGLTGSGTGLLLAFLLGGLLGAGFLWRGRPTDRLA